MAKAKKKSKIKGRKKRKALKIGAKPYSGRIEIEQMNSWLNDQHGALPGGPGEAQVFAPGTISATDIHHRVERAFDSSHQPNSQFRIHPATPLAVLWPAGPDNLWTSLRFKSVRPAPAFTATLFHGLMIPWADVFGSKTYAELVVKFTQLYIDAHWNVT